MWVGEVFFKTKFAFACAILALSFVAALLSGCESAGRFATYCFENPRNCD